MQKTKSTATFQGIIKVHPRGFGFIQVIDKNNKCLEVFVPKLERNGSIDGDIVEIKLNPNPLSAKKGFEGSVIKVVERKRTTTSCTVLNILSNTAVEATIFLCDNQIGIVKKPAKLKLEIGDRISISILSSKKALAAKNNKKNCKQIPLNRSEVFGSVISKIGHVDSALSDFDFIASKFNLDNSFTEETLAEAALFGNEIDKNEIKNRVDLRNLITFTIDSETAKDFDDALSMEIDKDNNYILGVHIADVSHYVTPNSHLDNTARERCNSTYFPGSVIPMLPHALSDNLCSLCPHQDRLSVSVTMKISPQGKLLDYDIFKSVINSHQRFTYTLVSEILTTDLEHEYKPELIAMQKLCRILNKQRLNRGCIAIHSSDQVITIDSKGEPIKISSQSHSIANSLVEEFMLKANEVVATHLSSLNKTISYRVHPTPNVDSLSDFITLAQAFGFNLQPPLDGSTLSALFDETKDTIAGKMLSIAMIRSMKPASYSIHNIGHDGLQLEKYTHFTSPIRRYCDLSIHRALFCQVPETDEELELLSLKCTNQESCSFSAEQSMIRLKKLRWLSSQYKLDYDQVFNATIISIKNGGIIFLIEEINYEDFLRFGNCDYNIKKHLFTPSRVHLGQLIQVKIVRISLILEQMEWILHHIFQEQAQSNFEIHASNDELQTEPQINKKKKRKKKIPSIKTSHKKYPSTTTIKKKKPILQKKNNIKKPT